MTELTAPAPPHAAPSTRPGLNLWKLSVKWLERLTCLFLFFAIWEFLPRVGIVSSAFLSPPSAVLAVLAGVSLGLLMGVVRRFEAFVDPLLQLFRQVSALALFPVFLLFFGIGEASKIAIIFWAAFWPVLLNTISGVKQVEKLLIHSALSMGATRGFIFFKVILPAAAPSIFTGIRLAGAYSITALVAAEMIGSHAGLGFLTLNSQEIFQIPSMYAGIVLLALLGLALNYVLALLEKRLTRWRSGLEFHE